MKSLRLRNANHFPRVVSKVSKVVDNEVSNLRTETVRLLGVGESMIVLLLIKLKMLRYVTVLDIIHPTGTIHWQHPFLSCPFMLRRSLVIKE